MSRALEVADLDAAKQSIELLPGNIIEITDASVFWPNLAGYDRELKKYTGNPREFKIALTEDQCKWFAELSREKNAFIRIKEKDIFTEEQLQRDPNLAQRVCHFINPKFTLTGDENRDPRVIMYTSYRGQTSQTIMNEDNISILDKQDIVARWDCKLRMYFYDDRRAKKGEKPQRCITFYLEELRAVVNKHADYGGFYEDTFPTEPGEQIKSAEDVEAEIINQATGDPMM